MTDKLQILKDLKNHLVRYYNKPIRDIILFGSQAAGAAKMNSDFDVLIVLENDYNIKDENTIINLCYNIDLKYNIVIDAHLISQSEINSLRGKQPIYIKAINNGIYV